jgi:alpha-tubulin suppressor-like RCC1 family protein
MAVDISANDNKLYIIWTDPDQPRSILKSDIGQLVINGNKYLFPLASNNIWMFNGGERVVKVVCGRNHTAVLLADGTVMTCGNNQFGQLGSDYLLGSSIGGRDKLERIQIVSNVIDIACGQNHTLLLLGSGQVVSYGSNQFGQLGISTNSGTTNPNFSPTIIPNINNAIGIVAGGNHTVIILSDGTIRTCGRNRYGQLGTTTNVGTTVATNALQTVSGISTAITATCGTEATAILLSNGQVRTFGFNQRGQLGVSTNSGTTTPVSTPQTTDISNVIDIAYGNEHLVLLTASGKVFTCGINLYGNLGYSLNSGTSNANSILREITTVSGVKQIGCGAYHTILILNDNRIMTVGLNQNGQLGYLTGGSALLINNTPTIVPDISNIIQVRGGLNHTVVLSGDGVIYTFGNNQFGQSLLGKSDIQLIEDYVIDTNITQIATGFAASHSAILLPNKTMKTFGYNNVGQLGIGTTNSTINSIPTLVDLSNIKYIAVGEAYNAIVLEDGRLATFGYNFSGQAGISGEIGSTLGRTTPFIVPNISTAIYSACGSSHTAVILSDNTLLTFGSNNRGQLGYNNGGVSTAIPQLVNLTDVKTVACGRSHTVVVLNNGQVYSFGLNNLGQLGHLTALNLTAGTSTPTLIPNISNATAVSCGNDFTLILLTNGQVISFGSNQYGQLGRSTNIGTTLSNYLPTIIPDISNVISISCGASHSTLLLNNGVVLTFGLNDRGQIGHRANAGTTLPNGTPAIINDISNATAIASGSSHTLILLSNGRSRVFGYNNYGQLGNGYKLVNNIPYMPQDLAYNLDNDLPTSIYRITTVLIRGPNNTIIKLETKFRVGPIPFVRNLVATNNILTINASWSPLADTVYYKLYQMINNIPSLLIDNISSTSISFNGQVDTSYNLVVSGWLLTDEESDYSDEAFILTPTYPQPIKNFIATRPRNNRLTLYWQPHTTLEEKGRLPSVFYRIQQSFGINDPYTTVVNGGQINDLSNSFTLTVPPSAPLYKFSIIAYNDVGDSSTVFTSEIIPCIPEWSKILTPKGYISVSSLTNSDSIITDKGNIVKIQKIYTSNVILTEENAPYRFEVGSIAKGYPTVPFDISPSHAIYSPKGGWIIPKYSSLSGIAAKQHSIAKTIKYYHIELPNYLEDNIVLEGGTIIESFGVSWLKSQPKGTVIYTFDNKSKLFKRISDEAAMATKYPNLKAGAK